MSIEIFFFIAAAMVAFMPTVWDMKVKGKNLNWWKRLTLAGKIYIIAFVSFFGTGLYLTISSHNESVVKEIKSNERIKSDSILMSNLTSKVTKLFSSDSLYRSAVKKGGYKYDSIKGIIIKPQVNIQNVQNNGRAIQNNAPNFGNQIVGDINLNTGRKFDDKTRRETLQLLKGRENQKISITSVMGDPEAFNLATEIKQFLIQQKFIVEGVGQGIFSEPIYGLIWDEAKNEIIVGSKPIK